MELTRYPSLIMKFLRSSLKWIRLRTSTSFPSQISLSWTQPFYPPAMKSLNQNLGHLTSKKYSIKRKKERKAKRGSIKNQEGNRATENKEKDTTTNKSKAGEEARSMQWVNSPKTLTKSSRNN